MSTLPILGQEQVDWKLEWERLVGVKMGKYEGAG